MATLTKLGDCARLDNMDFRAVRGANFQRDIRVRFDASVDDCGQPIKGDPYALPFGSILTAEGRVIGTDRRVFMAVSVQVLGSASSPAIFRIRVADAGLALCFEEGAQRAFTYHVKRTDFAGGVLTWARGRVTVDDTASGATFG